MKTLKEWLSRLPKLTRTRIGTGFWNFYAVVYDTLLALAPYNSMLTDMVAAARSHLAPTSAVLDAGCGSGNLTRKLLDSGYRVQSVDSSPGMLHRAASKCPGADCQLADLDRPLDFPAASFDAVLCSNVLYSLPRPAQTLAEFRRLLKPEGTLILANPKADFSMGKCLSQHWEQQGLVGQLGLLLRIPSLMLLACFNLLILSRSQKARLYFPHSQDLGQLLDQTGFTDITIGDTYGSQGLLATVRCA